MHEQKTSVSCFYRNAFTLVELLVGIGIMTIILGITLSGSPAAIMKLSLADNVYKVELMIREAQLQGSAINTLVGTFGGAGIFLNSATSTDVLKFKDRASTSTQKAIATGNGIYDSKPIDEKDSVFTLTNRHRAGKLCVATSTVSTTSIMCNEENDPPIVSLTIAFERPKQDAYIYVNNATSTTEYVFACLQFDSPKSPAFGFVKSIRIYRSGMIIKKSTPCKQ
jgi:prepilin-type N-terminal cleavage/methylation domain-containing protein